MLTLYTLHCIIYENSIIAAIAAKGEVMPDAIASGADVVNVVNVGYTIVDISGTRKSTALRSVGGTPTAGQVTALREAVGAITNGALIEARTTLTTQVNPGDEDVAVFDETFSAASTVAVFVFQDTVTLQTQRLEVAAPDATLFDSDIETINNSGDAGSAVITAALAVLNAGGGNYVYVRGYRAGHSFRASRPKIRPFAVLEPGVGDTPPALPGV